MAATRLTATALRDAIAAREVSPVEVVRGCLEAIDAENDRLNAFLAVDAERALAAAHRAEIAVLTGAELGPLHGVPIGVKDVEATADLDTTFGSRRHLGHRPAADSPMVAALRSAGAIVVGKTNTPAYALLGETSNELRGDCRNPWDTALTSGGSSGGSAAAVAAGLVPVASGTDYGGSVAAPAGLCGVVGLKPSHELVAALCPGSGSGVFDAVGALSTSVTDAALMMAAVAPSPLGSLPGLATMNGPARTPVVIGWSPDLGRYPVDPEVASVAQQAVSTFEELGCRVVARAPEVPDPWDVFAPLCVTDLRLYLREVMGENRDGLAAETLDELAAVPELTRDEYVAAVRRLRDYRSAAAGFLREVPVVATPTTATAAFPVRQPPTVIGGQPVRSGWHSFMPFQVPWNLTGGPVITVPAGVTADGRPVGLQLAAAPHADALLLDLAVRYEEARPWPRTATPRPASPAGVAVSVPGRM
jgi:Asp-tRNA(Asn)/Glu-tRNA(Gln) amidotransferase A subunit family amidase